MLELWTREMAKGECHCMSTSRAGLSTVKSVKTHWLCHPLKRKNDLNVNTLKHVQKRVNKESKQLVSVRLLPRVFVHASNGSGNNVAVFRAKQPAHLNNKNNNEDIQTNKQTNNTKHPLCFHKLTTESKQQLNRTKMKQKLSHGSPQHYPHSTKKMSSETLSADYWNWHMVCYYST